MIIALLASSWRRINAFVRNLLRIREECDLAAAARIQLEDSFHRVILLAETASAIIEQL